jgi:hypothetical protein
MSNMPDVSTVEYSLLTGEHKSAVVIPVEFPVERLDPEEMEVLDGLSMAVAGMTPVYAQQQFPEMYKFMKALLGFEKGIEDPANKKTVSDYISVVEAANAPWNRYRQSFVFPIERGSILPYHPLWEYDEILNGSHVPPPGRGLYPADISGSEFESLGDERKIKNSVVARGETGLEVKLDEERFRAEIHPVLDALRVSLKYAQDPALREYITGKIEELFSGTPEAIDEGWKLWVRNTGNIDLFIGTATETELDKFKGIRGAAQGTVQVANPEYSEISDKIRKMMPKLEQGAPWKQKKEIRLEQLPTTYFSDVLHSSGYYNIFPLNVIAESLPDEEDIINRYGSKNMVFVNLQEAIGRAGDSPVVARVFFLPEEMRKYQQHMSRMGMLMTSLHENGHRTGVLKGNSGADHFGEKYSILEEARAELFSMWALPPLVSEGIFTKEEEMAGYYHMLEILLFKGVAVEPLDHSAARNMMFHYFLMRENGAAISSDTDGKLVVQPESMRAAVRELLGALGDIRSEGNLTELERLREEYIRTDQKGYYQRRLKDLPLGRLPIFPEFEKAGGKFTGGLIYPKYRQQKSTLEHFI